MRFSSCDSFQSVGHVGVSPLPRAVLGAGVADVNPSDPVMAHGAHALAGQRCTFPLGSPALFLISGAMSTFHRPGRVRPPGTQIGKEVIRIHVWKNSSGRLTVWVGGR